MKISIITATYNSASTVKDTFESLLTQTYQDYEYIVIQRQHRRHNQGVRAKIQRSHALGQRKGQRTV